MRRLAVAIAVALLAGAVSPASAAPAKAARPSLTGMWDYQGRVEAAKTIPPPPVTAATQALLDRKSVAREGGYVRNVANMLCLPTGFPQMMQWKSPIEILESPGRVTVVSEHDPGNDEPRTIYLNRRMPAQIDPSWNGYSVGRWEGPVLVVETVGLNGRGLLFQAVPKTETARFTERLRLADGGKTLIDEMTITDPAVLTRPWVVTLKYNRMPADTERLEAVCEPDLEALKETDLKSLKDVDTEAARLLDPEQQYNAAGRR